MIIEDTFIQGLKLVHLNKILDDRGSFLKVYNTELFEENGLETNFKESYFSISHKNVIRGMHFQIPPQEHTKLVYLNQGKILDVVLDIRRLSKTFSKYFTIELYSGSHILLYIPTGCAHGFLSLEDNTMVTYLQTTVYDPVCDKGIKYNSFGMNWGITYPVVSKRDIEFIDLNQFNTPF